MSVPLIEIAGLSKVYGGAQPLRIAGLRIQATDRIVLSGLEAMAAEMFVYLVTGAALPDEGSVRVDGRDTREIATDTEWLTSLDRFGIVTHRAVLLDGMSTAANLALPLTVSLDPIPADVRDRVAAAAEAAGLDAARLDGPVGSLSAAERLRVHLIRAAIGQPQLVMLEHPTSQLNHGEESERFGETLRAVAAGRGFGWIAISDDEAFARGSGGERQRLDAKSGRVGRASGGWLKWLR
jgi:ABC-type lipoprotein export system ATPase subunit